MKVIIKVEHEYGEVISPIFTVPKKNGEYRMILNLKELNKSVEYQHFKMDTFESTLKLVKQGNYMASIDLRHAYYSVPIAEEQQKLLRFQWKNEVFQYVCLPNGISSAPRLFTKLLKPVYSTLRQMGHVNSAYIDDSYLSGESYDECDENVSETSELLEHVGFMINQEKSVLIPTTKLLFLGNWIDSINMIVTLPFEKVNNIVAECKKLKSSEFVKIRQVAQVLGLLVSSFSAVQYGLLYYRTIEKEKSQALSQNKGEYDSLMKLSENAKEELSWWIENLPEQKRDIDHGNPVIVIVTDSSLLGWGAVCNDVEIGGRWTDLESHQHINYLELLAAFHGIKSFCKGRSDIHVQIKSDNACCVAYINHMGGIGSQACNTLAFSIWKWCIERNIWISACFVPGIENIADKSSRKFNENVEWKLHPGIFEQLVKIWNLPEIDLFASRLNKQTDKFVSWHPDPDAEHVDAFTISWSNMFSFVFAPFSLETVCLRKIRQDQADCIFVCPMWTSQIWWPILMDLLIDNPRILPKRKDLLQMVGSKITHPLISKMTLIACRLSGNRCLTKTFHLNQPVLSSHLGGVLHKNNILRTLGNGFHSVRKGRLIQFKRL